MKKEFKAKNVLVTENVTHKGHYFTVTWDSDDEIKEPELVLLEGFSLSNDGTGIHSHTHPKPVTVRDDWFKDVMDVGTYKKIFCDSDKDFKKLYLAFAIKNEQHKKTCGGNMCLHTKYKATVTKEILNRKITVTVITEGNKAYAGYAICNPKDTFDAEKAKIISEGRAMNVRTNLLKGHRVGTLQSKHICKTIAYDLLDEFAKGKIQINGVNANTAKEGTTTEANKTTQRK